MASAIIVRGKLDYADGEYLITDERTFKTRILRHYIDPCVGKTITVSLDEPEEELEPMIAKRLEKAMAGA